jgi:hypothetical protein
MATDIEIIVGTYEEFVVGFRPQFSTKVTIQFHTNMPFPNNPIIS